MSTITYWPRHIETRNIHTMLSFLHPRRLVPGTQYYYTFGDTYGWSAEYSFTAAPKPGPNVTTRVVAYGGVCVCVYVCVCEGGRGREGGRRGGGGLQLCSLPCTVMIAGRPGISPPQQFSQPNFNSNT